MVLISRSRPQRVCATFRVSQIVLAADSDLSLMSSLENQNVIKDDVEFYVGSRSGTRTASTAASTPVMSSARTQAKSGHVSLR